jgi:hypothetical protein
MEGSQVALPVREPPEKYKKLQKEWKCYELVWAFVHYGLGTVVATLAFASSNQGMQKIAGEHAPLLVGVAGMLAATMTFMSPASRRKAYTEACNMLRVCRLRYETQIEIVEKDLNDAVERGQNIITQR